MHAQDGIFLPTKLTTLELGALLATQHTFALVRELKERAGTFPRSHSPHSKITQFGGRRDIACLPFGKHLAFEVYHWNVIKTVICKMKAVTDISCKNTVRGYR